MSGIVEVVAGVVIILGALSLVAVMLPLAAGS